MTPERRKQTEASQRQLTKDLANARGSRTSHSRSLNSEEKKVYESYFKDHSYYIDQDGTAYRANVRHGNVVLSRTNEPAGTTADGLPLTKSTRIQLGHDSARHTRVRSSTPSAQPGQERKTWTDEKITNSRGEQVTRTNSFVQESIQARAGTTTTSLTARYDSKDRLTSTSGGRVVHAGTTTERMLTTNVFDPATGVKTHVRQTATRIEPNHQLHTQEITDLRPDGSVAAVTSSRNEKNSGKDDAGRDRSTHTSETQRVELNTTGDPQRIIASSERRERKIDTDNQQVETTTKHSLTTVARGGGAIVFDEHGKPTNASTSGSLTLTQDSHPFDDNSKHDIIKRSATISDGAMKWSGLELAQSERDGSKIKRSTTETFSSSQLNDKGMPLEGAKPHLSEIDNRSWWERNKRNLAFGLGVAGSVLLIASGVGSGAGVALLGGLGGAMAATSGAIALSDDLPSFIDHPSWQGGLSVGLDALTIAGGSGAFISRTASGISQIRNAQSAAEGASMLSRVSTAEQVVNRATDARLGPISANRIVLANNSYNLGTTSYQVVDDLAHGRPISKEQIMTLAGSAFVLGTAAATHAASNRASALDRTSDALEHGSSLSMLRTASAETGARSSSLDTDSIDLTVPNIAFNTLPTPSHRTRSDTSAQLAAYNISPANSYTISGTFDRNGETYVQLSDAADGRTPKPIPFSIFVDLFPSGRSLDGGLVATG